MLETHKLASTITRAHRWWLWPYLLLCGATLLLLASLWLASVFPRPVVSKTEQAVSTQYENATQAAQSIVKAMAPEESIDMAWFDDLQKQQAPLKSFIQALKATAPEIQSRDPQSWPGRGNMLLDDLKILNQYRTTVLQIESLRTDLLALYSPTGKLASHRKPEASVARGFHMALVEWLQATAIEPGKNALTWAQLSNSHTAWAKLIGQVNSLGSEARLNEESLRMRADRELLEALRSSGLWGRLLEQDLHWAQITLAHERLHQLSEKLPSMPVPPEPSQPWQWSRLSYPGEPTQGLLFALLLLCSATLIQIWGHLHQAGIRQKSVQRWLNQEQQTENATRNVAPPLKQAQQEVETCLSTISQAQELLQSLKNTEQSHAPQNSELEAWGGLKSLHQQVEQDLQLVRTKLFNIHLQFCNGTNQEHLLYEIGFVTEGLESVSQCTKDMGRSLNLLSDSFAQPPSSESNATHRKLIESIQSLRAHIKSIQTSHNDIKARLDETVGDVPEGRRFEHMRTPHIPTGRARGETTA